MTCLRYKANVQHSWYMIGALNRVSFFVDGNITMFVNAYIIDVEFIHSFINSLIHLFCEESWIIYCIFDLTSPYHFELVA